MIAQRTVRYFMKSSGEREPGSSVYSQPRATYHGFSSQLGKPEAEPPAGVLPHERPGSSSVPIAWTFFAYLRRRWAVLKFSNRIASTILSLAQLFSDPNGLCVT